MKKLLLSLAALTMVAAPVKAQSLDSFYPALETFARSACNNAYNGQPGKVSASIAITELGYLHSDFFDKFKALPKSQQKEVDKMGIRAVANRCGTYSIPVIYAMGWAPLAREMGYQL